LSKAQIDVLLSVKYS